MDKCRVIFKTGLLTITLYEKPKKDPRSKIHIQSGDQKAILEFIMEKLSLFDREVSKQSESGSTVKEIKHIQRAMCGKCGKHFTNIKRVKQHILRMHVNKAKKIETLGETPVETVETVTLEEEVIPDKPVNKPPPSPPVTSNVRVESSPKDEPTIAENRRFVEDKESTSFIKTILNEMIDQCEDRQVLEKKVEKNFQCGECGEFFHTQRDVEDHMKSIHDKNWLKQSNRLKTLKRRMNI